MERKSLRRLGRFKVSRNHFEDWEKLEPLMSRMVVVRAEMMFDSDTINYIAFSQLFDEIEDCTEPPEYDLICATGEPKVTRL